MFVGYVLKKYAIHQGTLVLDDSDRARSKNTKRIAYTHKQKEKKTGGYVMGQSIVLLQLVTLRITLPVGFSFYQPDPAGSRDPKYPTKQDVDLSLLKQFGYNFPEIHIQCILADALYGNKKFMEQASSCFGGVQVISQLKRNQMIRIKGREKSIATYFKNNPGPSASGVVKLYL